MAQRKLTKIICTISDLNYSTELLENLYKNGMNIVRLNTAHQTPETTEKIIENIRKVSHQIAIMLDTKGPEMRVKELENEIIVNGGETLYVTKEVRQDLELPSFKVNYDNFVSEVPVGATILIDDGHLELKVTEKFPDRLLCTASYNGVIKNKKSVNVPDAHLNLPSITDMDRAYIEMAVRLDIDFIAHSFVRSKEDVFAMQQLLENAGSEIKVIAKIENREGVNNLDEILEHAYGILIARGDLGVEIPAEEVPIIQKKIIKRCREWCKPVITATHMLESMIKKPRATRAEISDVANAILDGTDAITLSGETAYGDYPVEATRTMAKIAKSVEPYKKQSSDFDIHANDSAVHKVLVRKTVEASIDLGVKAIVDTTVSGLSVRMISAYRSGIPVYAKCYSRRVMRELALSYGVFASYMEPADNTDQLVKHAIESLVQDRNLADEDLVTIIAATPWSHTGANFIEIADVASCLERESTKS